MMPEKIKSIFEHLSFTKTRTSIKIIALFDVEIMSESNLPS